jgi:hypothetical protein
VLVIIFLLISNVPPFYLSALGLSSWVKHQELWPELPGIKGLGAFFLKKDPGELIQGQGELLYSGGPGINLNKKGSEL